MTGGITIYRLAKRVVNKATTFLLKSGFHAFGSKSVICPPFRSGQEDRISVGSQAYIGPNCWIEVMERPADGLNPVIEIGDEVSMSGFCTITAVSRVVIGRGALIARYVHISDHSHATHDHHAFIKDQGVTKVSPVIIGEGAWLGHGVVICPGVKVGRNAVIGANSVVREDVPDYCVAVGCPARIVKRPATGTDFFS